MRLKRNGSEAEKVSSREISKNCSFRDGQEGGQCTHLDRRAGSPKPLCRVRRSQRDRNDWELVAETRQRTDREEKKH